MQSPAEDNGSRAPFPLEGAIERRLAENRTPVDWRPTALTRDFYLELARPIVRAALGWQEASGRIIDPISHQEHPLTIARFVGACGGLIQGGRDDALIEPCARALDPACEALLTAARTGMGGAEFYVKELVMGYVNVKDKADAARAERWRHALTGYDLERTYQQTLTKCEAREIRNHCTFGLAGEAFKTHVGLARNAEFMERYLEIQMGRFTDFGMYRDPNDPMTYDWVSRMNLTLMLHWGYTGAHAARVSELLRRGGLTSLLFVSTTGEAPYGGRSNQQNFNEATLALICEYEARRHVSLGNPRLAGVFKRTARLLALSIRRWLEMTPFRYNKTEFMPETGHGRDSYGYYSGYSLLIASQLGFAYLLADDSIPEAPAFCETGGTVTELPGAFHKVFATCGGYHVELDTRADPHYDATGLGRVHRAGVPTELGLSMPIPAHPRFAVTGTPAARNVALGPGWTDAAGRTFWLADLSDAIASVEVRDVTESRERVAWSVVYRIRLEAEVTVREDYVLTASGLGVVSHVPGDAVQVLVQIPLLETNGARTARLQTGHDGFRVEFAGHAFTARGSEPGGAGPYLEPFLASNRNGIYRVGCLQASGHRLSWQLELSRGL